MRVVNIRSLTFDATNSPSSSAALVDCEAVGATGFIWITEQHQTGFQSLEIDTCARAPDFFGATIGLHLYRGLNADLMMMTGPTGARLRFATGSNIVTQGRLYLTDEPQPISGLVRSASNTATIIASGLSTLVGGENLGSCITSVGWIQTNRPATVQFSDATAGVTVAGIPLLTIPGATGGVGTWTIANFPFEGQILIRNDDAINANTYTANMYSQLG